MENHGLELTRTHSDTKCAKITTGNTPNAPQLIQPVPQNRPINWDILEKSPHRMSMAGTDRALL